MQFLAVPTFVLDAQGRVLIWNKACEQLTGVAAPEVIGTCEHWRAFYATPRPCLSDLIVQGRMEAFDTLYSVHETTTNESVGVHAENWCVMPQKGTRLYLAIDAGPIYDSEGQLLAVVETLRDMTSLKTAQLELEQLATHDGLTGIINRRGFDRQLNLEWSRAARDGQALALLMVDVDHFKLYNDRYGHPMGDTCLMHIAETIAGEARRPSDVAARYGGEEFALLLPGIDDVGAAIVAQRILKRVANLAIPHAGNGSGQVVSVSIGVAAMVPDKSLSPVNLVEHSDQCLYKAKRSGRNCFAVDSC